MAVTTRTFAEEFADACREAGWVKENGDINKVAVAFHLGLDDTRTVTNWLSPRYAYGPRNRQLALMGSYFSSKRMAAILRALRSRPEGDTATRAYHNGWPSTFAFGHLAPV